MMQIRFPLFVILMSAIFVLAACGDESSKPEDVAGAAMPEQPAEPDVSMDMPPDDLPSMENPLASAVSDPARPEEDVSRDAGRKPEEVLAFAEFGPGDVIADIGATGGYYTRILSRLVGDKGHVYAFNPQEVADMFFADGNPSDAIAGEYENVSSVVAPFSAPAFDKPLDGVMIALFYHDSHWDKLGGATAGMNKALLDQLKPGGKLLIVDHHAEAGSGLRDVGTLHRIDAAAVKDELTGAGFEFVGESDILANTEDDRSKSVFDPSVRGKTDRFVYLFRKPE